MTKFGYIINEKKEVVDFFKLGSKRADEFNYITSINVANCPKNVVREIENINEINKRLRARLKYYLSIRNNENPDYGISWKGRFDKTTMFHPTIVLKKEMNLFAGNEDHIIVFLANIHNHMADSKLSWFLTSNHKEQRVLIDKL